MENSTIVWHELTKGKLCIVSYVVNTKSKGKKNILVLCTVPNLATLGITRDDGKMKPAAIKVYDFSKGGTDIVDQRVDSYTSATKSRRWPIKSLSCMLDKTRVNAQSVYCLNTGKNPRSGVDSRRFGWEMAKSLLLPHMKRRKECNGLSRSVRNKMAIFISDQDDGVALVLQLVVVKLLVAQLVLMLWVKARLQQMNKETSPSLEEVVRDTICFHMIAMS